jgi:hypothetical protein
MNRVHLTGLVEVHPPSSVVALKPYEFVAGVARNPKIAAIGHGQTIPSGGGLVWVNVERRDAIRLSRSVQNHFRSVGWLQKA